MSTQEFLSHYIHKSDIFDFLLPTVPAHDQDTVDQST